MINELYSVQRKKTHDIISCMGTYINSALLKVVCHVLWLKRANICGEGLKISVHDDDHYAEEEKF